MNPTDPTYSQGFQQACDDLHNGFARPSDKFHPVQTDYQRGWNARMDLERGNTFVCRMILVLVIIMIVALGVTIVQLWTQGS